MPVLDKSPKLQKVISDAAAAVWSIDWSSTFGIPHGACIPIAVFTAAYLGEGGIGARVVEAGARFIDPVSGRYAEMATDSDENALDARDEKGLDFLGHCVVQIPTHRAVIDLSLPTQRSQVMNNLGVPDVMVGGVDHTKGEVGFRSPMGRGQAIYRIYPHRDGWAKRNWPYAQIRESAVRAFRGEDEFAFLAELGYNIELS